MKSFIKETDGNENSRYYINRIIDLLQFNKMYGKTNQQILEKIIEYSKEQILDFSLLERGITKTLKLSGSKSKNLNAFFKTLLKSLRERQKNIYTQDPEFEDELSLTPEEPSVIPKKVYKNEL